MSHKMVKQFLAFSCFRNVFVVILAVVVFRERVIGITVFVSRTILSSFSFFFPFFQLTTLISVTSTFFKVLARQFASAGIRVVGVLAHSVNL